MKDRNLTALLKPRSLAMVGVSTKARFGADILRNQSNIGFTGNLYPVNPNYQEFEGQKCYPSLSALPEVPDCAIVLVPAPAVNSVIEEAGKLGVGAAIVVGQGFADLGNDEGRDRQKRLLELADTYGMAIAGPNCLGVTSFAHGFANTYAASVPKAKPGGISLVSQSGGLMLAAAAYAHDRGAGLNYLISCGNQAVVEIADYIDFLADDPETSVITVIMEGVRNGRRFREAVERAAPKKPLVILKLGRSVSGKLATFAHTGTLAGDEKAFATLFKQHGVALADSLDGLMETAMLLALSPLPKGDGCLMFTISGGMTGLIADLGEAAGLRFPPFSKKTNARIGAAVGLDRTFYNPMDTTGWPRLNAEGNLDKCLDAFIDDEAIDLIGLCFRLQPAENQLMLLPRLAERAKTSPKPLFFVSTSSYTVADFRKARPDLADFPILEDLELGQRAVSQLVDYGLYRKRIEKAPAKAGTAKPLRFDIRKGRKSLTEYESKKILAAAGLPVTKESLATTPAEAASMARKIGFPVALKIQSPDVMHKSDAGGVVLGVKTQAEAKAAFTTIMRNVKKAHPKAALDGVLVQEMVSGGTEMILGMNNGDLGPVVLCGMGGILVEVMKDVSLRFPPLASADVRDMLKEIKGAKLLSGYRGAKAGDMAALAKAVVAFSNFVARSDGAFAAIDINPLIVLPKGKGVRIADALIVPASKPKA
jgi:acetyltransferase